jgi:hypothetical protein
MQRNYWQRLALLLVGCALFFRVLVPAGWMPEANGTGLSLNWCGESGIGREAPAEARALLAKALGDKPAKPEARDSKPCAFAAAAQLLAFADRPQLILPRIRPEPARPPAPAAFPGRGLAAPPPLSTGPPLLA